MPRPSRLAVAAFTLIACPAVWFGTPHALGAGLGATGLWQDGFLGSLPELLAIGSFLYAPLLAPVMAFTYLALRRRLLTWAVWGPGGAAFGAAAVLTYGHFRLTAGPPRPEVVEVVALAAASGGLLYGILLRAGAGLVVARGGR